MPTRTPVQSLVLAIGAVALIAATAALAHLGLAILLGAVGAAFISAGRDAANARRAAYAIAALVSLHVVAVAGFDRTPPLWVLAETGAVLAILLSVRRSEVIV